MSENKLSELQANPITTNDDTLKVLLAGSTLAVGSHKFQLQVEDDAGNVSQPTQAILVVLDSHAPTAVLTIGDESGRPLTDDKIEFGKGFTLNGEKSVDIGGNIVKYTWTLLS